MTPVCVDFFGVPGCGKSTISHLLAEHLRTTRTVLEPTYNVGHCMSSPKRIATKIVGCASLLMSHPHTFLCLFSVIKGCGYSFLSPTCYKHLYNIAFKIKEMKDAKCECLIFDEGLWQSAVSLFFKRPYSEKEVLSVHSKLFTLVSRDLKDRKMDYMTVLVDLDTSTAMKRQDTRSAKPSRVQKMNEDARLMEINKQKNIFEGIKSDVVIKSDDICPSDNALFLYNIISERYE